MQRQDLLDRVDHYFSTDGLAIDLARRVAYRSESDTGQSPEALLNYLEKEMQPWLQAQGFVCEVLPNPVANAGPLLLARRIEDSALPTMLSYGHGDVVSGQEGAWREGLTLGSCASKATTGTAVALLTTRGSTPSPWPPSPTP